MTAPDPETPSTAILEPARPIPIRIVPRAAVEVLVAQVRAKIAA